MKVMLARPYTGDEYLQHYVISPKYDGIRCLVDTYIAISRSGKPIRNCILHDSLTAQTSFIQAKYPLIRYLDGELMHQQRGAKAWAKTSSAVMSYEGDIDDIKYYVFDFIPVESYASMPFEERLDYINTFDLPSWFIPVPRFTARSHEELNNYIDEFIHQGYEGAMMNHLHLPYKHGRSGKIGELVKCKKWDYDESTIVGIEEYMSNIGEPERWADGIIRRSKAAENLVPGGMLGAVVLENGLKVGTGFTEKQRKEYFSKDIIGKICRYKYLPSVGKHPRHPVLISIGDK